MRRANEKQHRLITHSAGYFAKITREGAPCGYLEEIFQRLRFAQSDSLGTSCNPAILSSAIWKYSIFGTEQPCRKDCCPVVPLWRLISEMIGWKMFLSGCGRRSWQEPVSSCLRKLQEDQNWTRGRVCPFLSTFQCVFYSPARPKYPHPVLTTL